MTANKLKTYQVSIFTTLFLGYACYAYNRKSVSFALPKLIEDGMEKSEAGLIISSQNMAYAISKFLGGVLSDRISSRLLFTIGLLVSGVSTLMFASSNSVSIFASLWFLNGFAQGCGWPACAKMLRKWYSPSQFGTWWSVLSSSANISGGLAPFVSAFLILNYGWRFSLIISGLVSIISGVISFVTLINSPEEVGLSSFDTDGSKKESERDESNRATIADLLRSPFLWLVSFCYMVVFCAKTSAVDWGQLYLMEDRNHSQYVGSAFRSSVETGGFFGRVIAGCLTDWALQKSAKKSSAFTSSVETGGFFGGVIAGYLTDWALQKSAKKSDPRSERGNPRMPVAVYFMVGVLACLHLLQFNVSESSSKLWITILGFILGACFYGPIAIYGVVANECAPTHLSGTSHAIVALAANVGAITSGLPFSYVAKYYNWGAIFFILEMITGITVLAMLLCRNIRWRLNRDKQD